MDERKRARFLRCNTLLACPVCRLPLELHGTSLACEAGHRFDLARQGYVNLLRGSKKPARYDRESFHLRRTVFENGLYEPIAEALCREVAPLGETARRVPRVLDAGCGEGYFARTVRARTGAEVCAFDISKDSVQLAAGLDADDGIAWLVADLAAIPILDGSIDCALDVFSPANYDELRRVLAPGGIVIKVVPTTRHLHELRERAAGQLVHSSYSNQRVLNHFSSCCTLRNHYTVSSTHPISPDALEALIHMTPLLFNVDTERIDWSGLTHVTVEAEVLIGTFE
ncbi:putative RNA methyltransferase [Enorma massiliensis]|uniref:putative RNA methyltransferase n=1 Tax=Enorma massiliensis TaxID=1472761 RepID=UPI002E797059|nr:methyltransferase domain-containing protein [Enorma massiliensis]